MGSDITFYLQASLKKERGKPDSVLVREHFKRVSRKIQKGKLKVDAIQYGHADDDVKKYSAEEYAKFSNYVAKNQAELYAEASKKLNAPYIFDYSGEPKKVAAKLEEVIEEIAGGEEE